PSVYGTQYDLTSSFTAVGVWSASETEIKMEGDVDGDGIADVVVYTYVPAGTSCPCLRRSSTPKVAGLSPSAQVPGTAFTQVENIVPLGGQPIFAAYDVSGNNVIAGGGLQVDAKGLKNIKSIRITMTTQGLGRDTDAHKDIQVTMTGMARLVNN
ncbi:MAG TPA: hypothetical protein VE133_17480, partial [Candidatus Sulfotelmatobacter sp.]|nr:hypothetical protein [Candidatus Sulfotelmatobacter sp.]